MCPSIICKIRNIFTDIKYTFKNSFFYMKCTKFIYNQSKQKNIFRTFYFTLRSLHSKCLIFIKSHIF